MNKVCVILDPGHGASTPGKCSPAALQGDLCSPYYFKEYQWVREFGAILRDKLLEKDIRVEFTVLPNNDADISLADRVFRTNQAIYKNNDCHCIFISLHVNAAGDGTEYKTARGYSIYSTKGENNSDILAACLLEHAKEELPKYGQKVRIYMSKYMEEDFESNFYVIKGANCPAILIEHMFQDNKQDIKFLKSDEGKQILADIAVEGIIDFAKQKNWL